MGNRNPCRGTIAVKLKVFSAEEDKNIAKKLRRKFNGSVASIRIGNKSVILSFEVCDLYEYSRITEPEVLPERKRQPLLRRVQEMC